MFPTSRKAVPGVLLVAAHDPAVFWTVCQLRGEGYRVLAACDGEQALDVFCHLEGRIDLALVDVRAPNGGSDLMSRIRRIKPDMKFLLLHDDPKAIFPEAGLPEYGIVYKPFTYRRLLSAVRSVLSHGYLAEAAAS